MGLENKASGDPQVSSREIAPWRRQWVEGQPRAPPPDAAKPSPPLSLGPRSPSARGTPFFLDRKTGGSKLFEHKRRNAEERGFRNSHTGMLFFLNDKSTKPVSLEEKNLYSFHCIKRNPGYWLVLRKYQRNAPFFFSRLTK